MPLCVCDDGSFADNAGFPRNWQLLPKRKCLGVEPNFIVNTSFQGKRTNTWDLTSFLAAILIFSSFEKTLIPINIYSHEFSSFRDEHFLSTKLSSNANGFREKKSSTTKCAWDVWCAPLLWEAHKRWGPLHVFPFLGGKVLLVKYILYVIYISIFTPNVWAYLSLLKTKCHGKLIQKSTTKYLIKQLMK